MIICPAFHVQANLADMRVAEKNSCGETKVRYASYRQRTDLTTFPTTLYISCISDEALR
jgi:hypothetical protein